MCCKYICPICGLLFVLFYNIFCCVEVSSQKNIDKFISFLWLVFFFSCFSFLNKCILFLKFYLFIFRQRGREGERETSMCGCLSCTRYWGLGPQPRRVLLTWNWTVDILVCRLALNPLSHTSQCSLVFLYLKLIKIFYISY